MDERKERPTAGGTSSNCTRFGTDAEIFLIFVVSCVGSC